MINKDGLIIKKARETDMDEILRLQHAAYQSEAEIYNDFSIQPLTQTLEQSLAEFQNSIVLKAVIDGNIVGSVRASENDNTTFIGKLMVLPSCQNKGVGKRLLQAIENECQNKRYELFTGAKSEKNIALYKKCGYTVFNTKEAAPGPTFVYMEKHSVRENDEEYSQMLLKQ
jgi:GNAT superfamily N-acetyltransferase